MPIIVFKNFPPKYSEISMMSEFLKFLKHLYIIIDIIKARNPTSTKFKIEPVEVVCIIVLGIFNII